MDDESIMNQQRKMMTGCQVHEVVSEAADLALEIPRQTYRHARRQYTS